MSFLGMSVLAIAVGFLLLFCLVYELGDRLHKLIENVDKHRSSSSSEYCSLRNDFVDLRWKMAEKKDLPEGYTLKEVIIPDGFDVQIIEPQKPTAFDLLKALRAIDDPSFDCMDICNHCKYSNNDAHSHPCVDCSVGCDLQFVRR